MCKIGFCSMSVMGGSPDNVHQAECAILCRPGGRMKNDGGFIAWAIGTRLADRIIFVTSELLLQLLSRIRCSGIT
jgi:hypothetical protein